MSLSPQRKAKCLEIIDSLLKYKISAIFAYPINPQLDNCPNYFTKIKKPMDLLTVQSNLINNKYNKFSEFCADVDQIWSNAIEFNGENSNISILAEQMKIWFHQMIFLMSDDEIADWVTQLNDLQHQVYTLTKQSTLSTIQSEQNDDPDTKIENSEEESYYSASDIDTEEDSSEIPPLQKSEDIPKDFESKKPKSLYTETAMKSSKSPKKKQSQSFEKSDDSDNDQFSMPMKTTKISQDKDKKTISVEELIELHHIITQLDDEEKLLKILNIIRKNEPNLIVNERSVIDMNDLSMTTRVKIYNLIQKMNE